MSLRFIFSYSYFLKNKKYLSCEIHPFSFFWSFHISKALSSQRFFSFYYSLRSLSSISHLVNKKLKKKKERKSTWWKNYFFLFIFYCLEKFTYQTEVFIFSFLFVRKFRNDKASAMMQIFSWFWVNDNKKFE